MFTCSFKLHGEKTLQDLMGLDSLLCFHNLYGNAMIKLNCFSNFLIYIHYCSTLGIICIWSYKCRIFFAIDDKSI